MFDRWPHESRGIAEIEGRAALYFDSDGNSIDTIRTLPHLRAMETELVAKRLEALANPTRLEIYRLLVRAGDAGLSVGQVQAKLQIPGSTLSHHLRVLTTAALLVQERQGTTLMCQTNFPVMRGLVDFLASECCADVACEPAAKSA